MKSTHLNRVIVSTILFGVLFGCSTATAKKLKYECNQGHRINKYGLAQCFHGIFYRTWDCKNYELVYDKFGQKAHCLYKKPINFDEIYKDFPEKFTLE